MKRYTQDELLIKVADILTADADIKAWCQSTYAKDQQVYAGINNEEPPSSDEYPLLVAYSVERMESANIDKELFGIEIGVGVYDNDISISGSKHTLMGLTRVLKLRQLAESAIITSKIGKIDVNSNTVTDSMFPFFSSHTVVKIEWPKIYSRPPR